MLAQHTEDMPAFDALTAMLIRVGRWNDLYSVYRDAANQTMVESRKKSLLFNISRLQVVGDAQDRYSSLWKDVKG